MRACDTEARRIRMGRYCEAVRAELIDLGAAPADLLGLRAGRLSELVIVARAAAARRNAGVAAVLHHRAEERDRWPRR